MLPLIITKDNFETEVLKSDKPVLLDFWATWCPPCKKTAPIIDEIASEYADIKVGKIDVDEYPEIAAAFGANSIPMLAVVRDGKVINQSSGAKPKAMILQMIGK